MRPCARESDFDTETEIVYKFSLEIHSLPHAMGDAIQRR
jgi:hypothetical protein